MVYLTYVIYKTHRTTKDTCTHSPTLRHVSRVDLSTITTLFAYLIELNTVKQPRNNYVLGIFVLF